MPMTQAGLFIQNKRIFMPFTCPYATRDRRAIIIHTQSGLINTWRNEEMPVISEGHSGD
jgi:hypothetical protein